MSRKRRYREGEYGAPDDTDGIPGAAGGTPAHGAELMQAIIDLIDRALDGADSGALDADYVDKLQAIKDIATSHEDEDEEDKGEEPADDTSSMESKRRRRANSGRAPLSLEEWRAKHRRQPKNSREWLESIRRRAKAGGRIPTDMEHFRGML